MPAPTAMRYTRPRRSYYSGLSKIGGDNLPEIGDHRSTAAYSGAVLSVATTWRRRSYLTRQVFKGIFENSVPTMTVPSGCTSNPYRCFPIGTTLFPLGSTSLGTAGQDQRPPCLGER